MHTRRFVIQVALAFAALYTIWGSTYLAIQIAGRDVPPFLMAGTRFLVAGGVLLACCAMFGSVTRTDLSRRNWSAAFVVGFGLMLVGNGGIAYSLQRIPSGIAAVIVALTPMWLVMFDWAQKRSEGQRGRPTVTVFVGIALGIAGIATLKFEGQLEGGAGSLPALDRIGILLTIVSTIGWAFGSIWGRTAPRPSSPVTACAMQMLAGGTLLLIASPLFESWSDVRVQELPPRFWIAWSYLIVFGSLCGFTAYIWLLQNVSAAKVGTYAYVNPIVAIVIGSVLNDERFTGTQAAACALVLTGVMVITLFRDRRVQPLTTPTPLARPSPE
ncbi:MAG: EamA family transporter [Phycisphaerae bacterium]|nr:EamA family transporter [Phycisphaerae bacterium]